MSSVADKLQALMNFDAGSVEPRTIAVSLIDSIDFD
jgi:hypothetical protein